MPVNSICPFTAVRSTEWASSPKQGSSNLGALPCMMNNKPYLFSSTSTARLSLAATGLFVWCCLSFWGGHVATGFLSVNIKALMPWLMKYYCSHTPFSAVWGSQKLLWEVSEKRPLASRSIPRPGRAKIGYWESSQDTCWWSSISWSKWIVV